MGMNLIKIIILTGHNAQLDVSEVTVPVQTVRVGSSFHWIRTWGARSLFNW